MAIACRRFKGSHTYDRIAELLVKIFHEWSIPPGKIVKAITDNGSNFLKAFREFCVQKEDERQSMDDEEVLEENEFEQLTTVLCLDDTSDKEFVLPAHQSCCSHTLSLICTADITKTRSSGLQKSAFAKCQGIWNKISRSTAVSESVREICGVSLPTPVCTRWNTLFDALMELLKYESKLAEICEAASVPEFRAVELEFLKQYVLCVEPIALALDRLQGESRSFYGELLPTLVGVEKKLNKLTETKPSRCPDLPSDLLKALRRRFKEFLDFTHDEAIIAAISHPFFKLRWIPKDKLLFAKELFVAKAVAVAATRNSENEAIAPKQEKLNVQAAVSDQKPSRYESFFEFEDNPGHDLLDPEPLEEQVK